MLNELNKKDMKKMECILRSIFTFWNNPNLEDSIVKAKKSTHLKCVKIGKCDVNGIYLVDGDIVKFKCFPDFVEGGNDAVYGKKKGEVAKFMPDNHIWLDAHVDINSLPYICFHELWEKYNMVEYGLKYDDAHNKADELEMLLRKNRHFESKRKVLDFPRVQQPDSESCGHACISMVLQYFELREKVCDLEDLKECCNDTNGLEPETVVKILKKFKVKSYIKRNLSFEQIKKDIDNDKPIIIELQAYADDDKEDLSKTWEFGHYIVIIGYTLDYLIFADPASFFKGFLKFEELLPRWHAIDNGKKQEKLAIIIETLPKEKEFDSEKTVHQN